MLTHPVIDAHHHVWDGTARLGWFDPDTMAALDRGFSMADLLPELRGHGVAGTVLVEAGQAGTDETAVLLAQCAAVPEVLGVVGHASLTAPSLTAPGLAAALARYQARADGHWLKGIRDPGLARACLDGRDGAARDSLRQVAAAGLVCDLGGGPRELSVYTALARELPAVTFVLDHLGKPRVTDGRAGLREWQALIAPLAGHPNVAAKLSGLVTEASWDTWRPADLRAYVDIALDLFGPDRLMFGSDWPVCLLAASYGQVRQAMEECLGQLGEAGRAAVLGGTAARWYGLAAEAAGETGSGGTGPEKKEAPA